MGIVCFLELGKHNIHIKISVGVLNRILSRERKSCFEINTYILQRNQLDFILPLTSKAYRRIEEMISSNLFKKVIKNC